MEDYSLVLTNAPTKDTSEPSVPRHVAPFVPATRRGSPLESCRLENFPPHDPDELAAVAPVITTDTSELGAPCQLWRVAMKYRPKLDPRKDLKGATPEKLARALFRRTEPLPAHVPASVAGNEIAVEEIAADEPGHGVAHLDDGS